MGMDSSSVWGLVCRKSIPGPSPVLAISVARGRCSLVPGNLCAWRSAAFSCSYRCSLIPGNLCAWRSATLSSCSACFWLFAAICLADKPGTERSPSRGFFAKGLARPPALSLPARASNKFFLAEAGHVKNFFYFFQQLLVALCRRGGGAARSCVASSLFAFLSDALLSDAGTSLLSEMFPLVLVTLLLALRPAGRQ